MKSERYNKTQHNTILTTKKKRREAKREKQKRGRSEAKRDEMRQSVRGENKACKIEIEIEMR